MRKTPFVNGKFYHIYNRGVDKRTVFEDQADIDRFFQSMDEFNSVEPIGSIFLNSIPKNKKDKLRCPTPQLSKLVNVVCYCLNPNHYHFILEQVSDGGISEFMKRLGGGYTNYFNEKHERSGSLFQGRFKSIHISSDEYLLYVSVYVNLNNRVHKLQNKIFKSSWEEYTGEDKKSFCKKDIILGRFRNRQEYQKIAEETLQGILEKRYDLDQEGKFFLE